MGLAVFLGVALILVGLIHYYLWRRLVRATTRTRRWRRVGTWTIVALTTLLVATLIGGRVLPHSVAAAVSWPGYLWLAIMFYLLLTLLVLELPALAGRALLSRGAVRAGRPASHAATIHTRTPQEATVSTETPRPETSQPETSRRWKSRSVAWAAKRQPAVAVEPRPVGDPARPRPTAPDADLPAHATHTANTTHTANATDAANAAHAANPAGERLQSRRRVLARAVAVGAGLVSASVVASGVGSAMGPPQLKRVQIPIGKLPRVADGYRVALVSDIHLGPLRGYSHTRRIVDMINSLDADIVAVVGDLVDGSVAELGEAASPLRELRSRHGAYFVTGNHEYYSGYQEWNDEVARLGLRHLRNEWVELPGGFDLSGVNDVSGASFDDGPDFDKALGGRDPRRAVVVLAHQPIQAHDAARHGVDLQLSGHTHGGQLAPFNVVVRLAQQPVVSGLGQVDGMPVYVTNGAGFWGPPVRVGAPPDVTLVQLRSA